MKPPRQFILWYFHGVDQRVLHEGFYPGTLALRLAVLTYVGTSDHETFELGELSQRPTDELLSQLLRDEFVANDATATTDEFSKTVEAFAADGLFLKVSLEEIQDRGLDPKLFGSLLILNRPHLAKLAREFGFVRQRAEELLGEKEPAPLVPMVLPPADEVVL